MFIEFWNRSPHIETALELAKIHLDAGDNVIFNFAGHDRCDNSGIAFGPIKAKFLRRKLPEIKGIELIGSDKIKFYPRCKFKKIKFDQFDGPYNLDALREYKYANFDVGLAVISSLISTTKNPDPDINSNLSKIKEMITNAIQIYEFAKEKIKEERIDLVYIFNGRFYDSRAVMSAALNLTTPFLIHERGATKDSYSANDFMPHDMHRVQDKILENWTGGPLNSKAEIAHKFFIERRRGIDQAWTSFSKDQEPGKTPRIESGKKVITYYSSSDDEFASVGDIYKWVGWKDQYNAVTSLIAICSELNNIQLFIRLHPHLKWKSAKEQEKWTALSKYSVVNLISYDDKVDSYTLLDSSDVVITSGSTIGIEAVYWGRPSITLGPSTYEILGATSNPKSNLELKKLLQKPLAADPSKALPYGFYMATFGIKFKYYQPVDLFTGKFLGVDLHGRDKFWYFLRSIRDKCKKII